MTYERQMARRYRIHAEDLRMVANKDDRRATREVLLRVARDYERMADSLEAIDRNDHEAHPERPS